MEGIFSPAETVCKFRIVGPCACRSQNGNPAGLPPPGCCRLHCVACGSSLLGSAAPSRGNGFYRLVTLVETIG